MTVATLLLSAITMAQTIIYVDADATGNSDGTSWTNAYNDLYVALYASSNDPVYTGAQIWIAEGFYTRLSQNQTFDVNNDVLLYGGFEGTESSIDERDIENHPTIISGDVDWNDTGIPSSSNLSMGQNAANIFRVLSPTRALFDGLIIEHAFSTTASGGGIKITNEQLSNLEISNFNIRENVSSNRAGVLYYTSQPSSFYMFNNIIENNVNTDMSSSYTVEYRITGGAAISSIYGEVHVVNNLFKNNSSDSPLWGGTCGRFTMLSAGSEIDLYLTNNTFIDNEQGIDLPSLFAYELGANNTEISAHINNNIAFNNPQTTSIIAPSTGFTSGFEVNGNSSSENVLDFTDTYGMTNTHTITSSPFTDYANGDYTPVTAYQTNGNLTMYGDQLLDNAIFGQAYPTTDLAGNPRFNSQGELAIGAYQPDGSASLSGGQSTSDFVLYPNPVSDVLNIDFSKNVAGELILYSIAGNELSREPINGISKKMLLDNIPNGSYFVKIETKEKIYTEMITVK